VVGRALPCNANRAWSSIQVMISVSAPGRPSGRVSRTGDRPGQPERADGQVSNPRDRDWSLHLREEHLQEVPGGGRLGGEDMPYLAEGLIALAEFREPVGEVVDEHQR